MVGTKTHQTSEFSTTLSSLQNIFFCTNVRNNKLDFDSFLSRLRTKLNILREVSLENKTLNSFQSTWAHLKINTKYYINVNAI